MPDRLTLADIRALRAHLGDLGWAVGGAERLDRPISPELLDWLIRDDNHASAGVLDEAVELEFASSVGERTEVGVDARVALTRSPSLRLFERSAAGARTLIAGLDSGAALLVESTVDGALAIGYRTSEEVPQFVAGWLPLDAEWNVDLGGIRVSDQEIEAALAGTTDPSGDELRDALLSASWSVWGVDAGDSIVEFASIGGWGIVALERGADGVSLHPVATGDVLLTLIESMAVQIWK